MGQKTVHRLEEIRVHYGYSVSAFEKSIGYSNNGFHHAIKNSSDIKDEIIRNTLDSFPKVSYRWLLFGKGEMHGNDRFTVRNCSEFLADNLNDALEDKEFLRLLNHAKDRKDLLEMREKIESLKESKTSDS